MKNLLTLLSIAAVSLAHADSFVGTYKSTTSHPTTFRIEENNTFIEESPGYRGNDPWKLEGIWKSHNEQIYLILEKDSALKVYKIMKRHEDGSVTIQSPTPIVYENQNEDKKHLKRIDRIEVVELETPLIKK